MPAPDPASTARGDWRPIALTIAAVFVLIPPLLFAVVQTSPIAHFDIDPRTPTAQMTPMTIGPTAIAWIQVLTVVISAGTIAISAAAGGATRWWWATLTGIGVAVALTHLGGPIDQWLEIGAWISSACLGLAAAHLAQHELPRRWMVAALIALLVPLALNGAYYVLIEHPMTVVDFQERKAEILASRGWTEGSSSAEIFERRATDPSVVGAYGLSNVFGSVVAALTLLAVGAASASYVRANRWQSIAWWVLPIVAVFGGITLLLTQSKGVTAAWCAGLALLAFVWLVRTLQLPRWTPAAGAAGLVLTAIGVVAVRGWIGAPETWEGERSLLFRWYYWEAAARAMIYGTPLDWLRGLGPERFHVEYELYKNALSPEVVTSTHSVFVDYVTMLGAGGLAWVVLLLTWIMRPLPESQVGPMHSEADESLIHPAIPTVALAVVVFGVQYAVKVSQLWIDSVLVWMVGAIGFIAVASLLVPLLRASARMLAVAAFAAATMIVVHAQIEMTFFHYPSLPMVWLLVGLAGGSLAAGGTTATQPRAIPGVVVAGVLATAIALAVGYAAPMTAVQASLAEAADALQRGQPMVALDALDRAGHLAPADARVLRWRVQLRQEWAMEAARTNRRDQLEQSLGSALVVLDHEHAVIGPSPHRLRSNIHRLAAEITGAPAQLQRAADARALALTLSPYNLDDVVVLAELYDALGRTDDARQAYRRALELSDLSYLDPAEQLLPEQRAAIEAKLNTP